MSCNTAERTSNYYTALSGVSFINGVGIVGSNIRRYRSSRQCYPEGLWQDHRKLGVCLVGWQWVFNFPSAGNPILEDGNVDCSAGQSGEVWYLAGSFGSKAERTCTIKKGKAVFFPLLNGLYWTPLDPAIPEDCTDVLSCRTGVSQSIDKITGWSCTVDNVPCVWFAQVVRAQSNARRFNIPPGSVATDFGYAPGVRKISISDGYWVMLDPLPLGEHTIHFTSASAAFPDFALDVTYHLTVSALKD